MDGGPLDRRRDVAAYIALAWIWGLSFLLLLKVVEAFGWIGAVSFRAFVASGLLLLIARASRRSLRFAGTWRHLAVVGATTVAAQLVGLSYSTPRIGTAMAAIIVGAIPLFSMVIGHWWGLEEITSVGRMGLVLGFIGIVLLVGFPAVEVTTAFVIGCAASIASAISAAFGSNYARRHLRGVGSWEQTIGAFLIGGVIALPLLVVVPLPRVPVIGDYLYLIALAGFCSALAYVLYFRLVADLGATTAISVEFLVTVIAVAVGALVLDEHLSVAQLVGGVTIIIGCALVLGLVPTTRRRRTTSASRS